MLDVKIAGGVVIDGTGAPRHRADVGIADGCIVAVGEVHDDAREVIDAGGLIVAPGFVDSHTHHDAQLLWDPSASPSCFHGVTTVIAGNCGFTIAPLTDSAEDYVMRMLARVEGMPLDALRAGPPWRWRSFGEYLAEFDGRLGVNAGFLLGHSTLRAAVLGTEARGAAADERQLEIMQQALAAALRDGALGFSSSRAATHHDGDGQPIPSRFADRREFIELARVLADFPGTFVGFNPGVTPFEDADIELMIAMAHAAHAPLTWNAFPVESNRPDVIASVRELAERAWSTGAEIYAQVIPDPRLFFLSFANGFLFDSLPGWAELFALPIAERLARLADPDQRRMLARGAANPSQPMRRFFGWETMTVVDPTHPHHVRFAGCKLPDVAASLGKDIYETLFDLVLANGVHLNFTPQPSGDDDASWTLRAELWRDPRMVIGAADAGAHLDNASSFTYSTSLLGRAVRGRKLLTLEEAVHELTAVPARVCRLADRGRLAAGCAADVVMFDERRIDYGPLHMRADLPGGARRLFADAVGIERVIVNGETIVSGNQYTGALPGHLLRPVRSHP